MTYNSYENIILSYYNICRYLSEYMRTRESMHQAHKLLGQIHEANGEKRQAVESFKRYVLLNDLVLVYKRNWEKKAVWSFKK